MNSPVERMAATGIGFAGIDGVWWRPAVEPFTLPEAARCQLADLGRAIFALLDVVSQLFDTPEGDACGLSRLLLHKTPQEIAIWRERSPVYMTRPDFQIVMDGEGAEDIRFAATELEICPSAQGFAHAMQVGYGLSADLADAFVAMLDGREAIIACSAQWSEFIFDQLAFCRALSERGVQARLLLDRPLAHIAEEVIVGRRWQPPIFGVRETPPGWNLDVLGRLHRSGLDEFIWQDGEDWPATVGDAVVFRFGYIECFDNKFLQQMSSWRGNGATFVNPLCFVYDSKTTMAAFSLNQVRAAIESCAPGAVAVLDHAIPHTLLLDDEAIPRLLKEQDEWVIKFAGFDKGNQAWGGRSLCIGSQYSRSGWEHALRQAVRFPWPVVAQRWTPSHKVRIQSWGKNGERCTIEQGASRVRVFLLRAPDQLAIPCGAHLTVSDGTLHVAEATDAVQTPIAWRNP